MNKMKKTLLIILASIVTVTILPAQDKLEADAAATLIEWKGNKIVGSEHTGIIDLKADGSLSTATPLPEASS